MAQSATTVTPPSPTPPTNLSSTGTTGPNPPNYTKLSYSNWVGVGLNEYPRSTYANMPPFYNDGIPAPTASFASANEVSASVSMLASRLTFIANTAALASGTGATSGGTENTYPGTGTAGLPGAVPASTSIAHEGAGTETLYTKADYNAAVLVPIALQTVGSGPNATAASILAGPNASHASSLSPATNPTFSSFTAGSSVSGAGTTTLSCVTVGATPQSVVYVNGVPQLTVFVSSTSLTCAAVTKKATAGNWDIKIVTGGVIETAPRVWTFT